MVLRIIAGLRKGRKLRSPSGLGVRPTSDRVKESLFNIIQFDIQGRKVLDLFAGTGQLGIEALSRGASSAVFVDSDSASVELVKENLRLSGFESCPVVKKDYEAYLLGLPGGVKFGLVFLDPPYGAGAIPRALEIISDKGALERDGIIVCESDRSDPLPEAEGGLKRLRAYRYGRTVISLYVWEVGAGR